MINAYNKIEGLKKQLMENEVKRLKEREKL